MSGSQIPSIVPDSTTAPRAPFANRYQSDGSGTGHLSASGVDVSIVIPVYNSEATVARLCDVLVAALTSRWRLQIVLVEDGSADNSAEVCRRLHHRHRGIVDCVLLSKNFGEHNAVMAGLHEVRGQYCIIMDDDFQNPPSEVEVLLAEIAKGYDVVYVRYADKQHHVWRNFGSRLHNFMATHALKKPSDLYLSSFKALSHFLVREIIQYPGPDPYIDAIVLRTTRRIGTVMVKHHARTAGQSGYTTAKLLSLWSNMIVGFSIYPLRVVAILGFIMAALGILFGLFGTITIGSSAMLDPEHIEKLYGPRWLIRGGTLIAICIVGEYIGRIYRHLNRAPQFIVREKLIWPAIDPPQARVQNDSADVQPVPAPDSSRS
jgi:glycosyltransferase involved in cell wall biosynthesis